MLKYVKFTLKGKLKRGIGIVVLSISFLVLFRVFVADLYFIPTGSMKNTIAPRSYVILSKVTYGAILPNTTHEIPLISKILKLFPAKNLWNDTRVCGFKEINKGDIIVTKYKNIKLAKRIVGTPGDIIKIQNGLVSVNDRKEIVVDTYQYKYNSEFTREEVENLKDTIDFTFLGHNQYDITLSGAALKKTENKEMTAQSMNKDRVVMKIDTIFPKVMYKVWDENNYGPILIPYKGLKIELNKKNIALYKEIINTYENIAINWSKFPFLPDKKNVLSYTFTNDYYFLMGDNRMKSMDSRFIGFIPKKNILGKILFY